MRAGGGEVEQGWGEDVCRLLQGLWLSFCVNWRVSLEQKVMGPPWLLCGERLREEPGEPADRLQQ